METTFQSMKFRILLLILQQIGMIAAEKKLVVQNFKMCNDSNNDYMMRFDLKFNTKNNVQHFNATATILKELGNNMMVHTQSYASVNGRKDVKILEMNEKFCDFVKKFIGPLFRELEKAAQIIPGTCPIPKGTYHLLNYQVNFRKLFIKEMLPLGSLKISMEFIDTVVKKQFSCFDIFLKVTSV